MPHGTAPPDPDKALIQLYDGAEKAHAVRDWELVRLCLEQAADIVERTRLSLVKTDPPPVS